MLVALIVIWYVYGAAVASWHIANSEFFEPWQKVAQHLITWLLPVVGVAIILHTLGPDVRKRRPGWIPLLEPLVLAGFGLSVSNAAPSDLQSDASSGAPSESTHGGNGSD
jgi:hypothetical protein